MNVHVDVSLYFSLIDDDDFVLLLLDGLDGLDVSGRIFKRRRCLVQQLFELLLL